MVGNNYHLTYLTINLLLIIVLTFSYLHWRRLDQHISNKVQDMECYITGDREYQIELRLKTVV